MSYFCIEWYMRYYTPSCNPYFKQLLSWATQRIGRATQAFWLCLCQIPFRDWPPESPSGSGVCSWVRNHACRNWSRLGCILGWLSFSTSCRSCTVLQSYLLQNLRICLRFGLAPPWLLWRSHLSVHWSFSFFRIRRVSAVPGILSSWQRCCRWTQQLEGRLQAALFLAPKVVFWGRRLEGPLAWTWISLWSLEDQGEPPLSLPKSLSYCDFHPLESVAFSHP